MKNRNKIMIVSLGVLVLSGCTKQYTASEALAEVNTAAENLKNVKSVSLDMTQTITAPTESGSNTEKYVADFSKGEWYYHAASDEEIYLEKYCDGTNVYARYHQDYENEQEIEENIENSQLEEWVQFADGFKAEDFDSVKKTESDEMTDLEMSFSKERLQKYEQTFEATVREGSVHCEIDKNNVLREFKISISLESEDEEAPYTVIMGFDVWDYDSEAIVVEENWDK